MKIFRYCLIFAILLTAFSGAGTVLSQDKKTPENVVKEPSPEDLAKMEDNKRIILSHDLKINLDPATHKLAAEDTVAIYTGPRFTDSVHVMINRNLNIDALTMDGAELKFRECTTLHSDIYGQAEIPLVYRTGLMLRVKCLKINLPARTNDIVTLKFTYSGEIYDMPQRVETFRHIRGDETSGVICEDGIYLSGATYWYPNTDNAFPKFRVQATAPEGWEIIGQGSYLGKTILDETNDAEEETESVEESPENPDGQPREGAFKPIEEPKDGQSGEKPMRPVNSRIKWVTTWESPHPSDELALVGGRYVVQAEDFNGIRIAAYLFPEDQANSDTFVQTSKKYLDLYSKLISPYPYKSFSIVENFFSSGYGMPSYTLLGTHNIKMPQRYTGPGGLGHEILHCWWGNYVFVDYSGGNWCEGLTTYMSNYYFKELEEPLQEQINYRADISAEYAMSVTRETDYELVNFMGKTTEQDNVLGYGKVAMTFHMLRKLVGDDAFFSAIRDFAATCGGKRANWGHIQASFEKVANENLDWFFDQWLRRKGAPRFFIEDVRVAEYENDPNYISKVNKLYTVDLHLRQKSENAFYYKVMLPIYIETETDQTYDYVFITGDKKLLKYKMPSKPLKIIIDPEFHIFKKLEINEISPCYDLTLADQKKISVYPTKGTEEENAAYKKLAEFLNSERGIEMVSDEEVTEEQLLNNSVFVFGGPLINSATAKAVEKGSTNKELAFTEKGISVSGTEYAYDLPLMVTEKNPFNQLKNLTIFSAPDAGKIANIGRVLAYYKRESYYVWAQGSSPSIRGRFTVHSAALEFNNED